MAKKPKKNWLEPPNWWKKWKPLRWIAVITIIVSLVSMSWTVKEYVLPPAEHSDTAFYTSVEEQRVELGGFRSYDNMEAVRKVLSDGKFSAQLTQLHSSPSSAYPIHQMDTLTVEKYTHLGQAGQLTLEFFNDRLYEVDFNPVNPKTYVTELHKAFPALKGNMAGASQLIDGSLRIASNVDLAANSVGQSLGSNAYVIWQDMRLIRQRDQWDMNFSAAPTEPRKILPFL